MYFRTNVEKIKMFYIDRYLVAEVRVVEHTKGKNLGKKITYKVLQRGEAFISKCASAIWIYQVVFNGFAFFLLSVRASRWKRENFCSI